ncbi:pilus assembly protein TadG-related protein [Streptomyces glaucosporus]|uniref:Pilus assembly protein TadG-related protein n=1 Tax=Streptomyces glaucosporus TaxID=284044 RepID=A0ABN3I6D8_9ACTN
MRHRSSEDRGQAFPIYIVVVASLLFLAFAFFAVGQAAATRNGAQGAADAAALAAAQDARDQLGRGLLAALLDPDQWEDLLSGSRFGTAGGCEEAERFADRNRSDVVSCDRASFPHNGFTVKVRTRYTVGASVIPGTDEEHGEATATAVVEPRCELGPEEPGEEPEVPEEPGDPGEDEDEGGKVAPIELTCDGLDLTIDPSDPDPLPGLERLFTVRLAD